MFSRFLGAERSGQDLTMFSRFPREERTDRVNYIFQVSRSRANWTGSSYVL